MWPSRAYLTKPPCCPFPSAPPPQPAAPAQQLPGGCCKERAIASALVQISAAASSPPRPNRVLLPAARELLGPRPGRAVADAKKERERGEQDQPLPAQQQTAPLPPQQPQQQPSAAVVQALLSSLSPWP